MNTATMNGHAPQPETDAKTLLQNAAKVASEAPKEPQEPQTQPKRKTGTIAKTEAVKNEFEHQAASLVQTSQETTNLHLKAGIRDGEADNQAYDAGYKIGLLKGRRSSRLKNTVEIIKQTEKLNDFADATTGEASQESFSKFIGFDEQELEDLLANADSELEGLLGKHQGTSELSLFNF